MPTPLNPARQSIYSLLLITVVICTSSLTRTTWAQETQSPDEWIIACTWDGNDHVLATTSGGLHYQPSKLLKIAADDTAEQVTFGEAESSLWSVLRLANGSALATDYQGAIQIFGQQPQSVESETGWIRATQHAPGDGSRAVAGSHDGKLLVIDTQNATVDKTIDAHNASVFDIAFSQDGSLMATASGEGVVKIYSWPDLEEKQTIQASRESVWSLLFLDSDQLVTAGADRHIKIWDVPTGQQKISITAAANWVTSLVQIPDTSLLVAGSMDGVATVIDFETLHSVMREDLAESGIWSLALSPNGKRLAAGTRKHGLKIVELAPWIAAGQRAAASADRGQPPQPTAE